MELKSKVKEVNVKIEQNQKKTYGNRFENITPFRHVDNILFGFLIGTGTPAQAPFYDILSHQSYVQWTMAVHFWTTAFLRSNANTLNKIGSLISSLTAATSASYSLIFSFDPLDDGRRVHTTIVSSSRSRDSLFFYVLFTDPYTV